MTINELIAIALKEVGTCEFPANSNNVKYNTWYYGRNVYGASYPWCAVFISWLFKDTNLVKKTASCADMLEWFEGNSRIVKSPQAGDIVFFKYKTNNRRTNHVGLVVSVKGKTITTIEGNTSQTSQDNGGKVMKRTRSKNIVAYARPKYEDAVVDNDYPTLRMGSKGDMVVKLQIALKNLGYHVGGVDGIFGVNTCNAVIEFQSDNNLLADGIVGKQTWARLNDYGK